MCGIVGLLGKTEKFKSELGVHAAPMMVCMGARGIDSSGMAFYNSEKNGNSVTRINLYAGNPGYDWQHLQKECGEHCHVEGLKNHGLIKTDRPKQVESWLTENHRELRILSSGEHIDIFKDTGAPETLIDKYHLREKKGTHCIGHTRMATESEVTPYHSHPFSAGADLCLVHNGSLSNPNSLRRMLERRGMVFETDNDTEAACRFFQWRLNEGDSIEQALKTGLQELDGFYTLLIGTEDKMVLVRDPFACKPAVVAETKDYVAIGSEFRTLAHLPGIENASLFEPNPEEIYAWSV